MCCCCEPLNSCSALSQKGLWLSGDGEWSLQPSNLGAPLNGRGYRNNVSLIDCFAKYTWEFSTWGSSQRCCSGSSDLNLLAGSGYFWVLLTHSCRTRWVLLVSCLPSRTSQLSWTGSKIWGEQITQAKGVCRPLTVAWGDKGREGGPGEGGVGVQWLPRPEQKSSEFFCIHSDAQQFPALFLQSACSTCFYLTISCLQLPKTGEITICHKISLYGPFWAGFTHLFFLSSVHRSFRLRHCVLCVHVYVHVCVLTLSSYVRKLCACSLVLSLNFFPSKAWWFLPIWGKKQTVALRASAFFWRTEGSRYSEEWDLPITFKYLSALPPMRNLFSA